MDEIREKMQRAAQARREAESASKELLQEKSRRRLLKLAETKCRTGFIGALELLEEYFGHLWCHGEHQADLSPNQAVWLDIYKRCRTAILDNGNKQSRALRGEFAQYTVEWNGYRTEFLVRNEED